MNELLRTLNWQSKITQTPTDKTKMVAIGCMIEEIAETYNALSLIDESKTQESLGVSFKTGEKSYADLVIDRRSLLDGLCDIVVTCVGVACMFDLDINTAIARINDSNYSKFVDGVPIFDDNGKVKKGPNYIPPDLTDLY